MRLGTAYKNLYATSGDFLIWGWRCQSRVIYRMDFVEIQRRIASNQVHVFLSRFCLRCPQNKIGRCLYTNKPKLINDILAMHHLDGFPSWCGLSYTSTHSQYVPITDRMPVQRHAPRSQA